MEAWFSFFTVLDLWTQEEDFELIIKNEGCEFCPWRDLREPKMKGTVYRFPRYAYDVNTYQRSQTF